MAVLLGAIKSPKPHTYYNTYSSAVIDVYDYVSEKYDIDSDDWFNEVSIGGKPKSETTKRSRNIRLYSKETGKESRKSLNIQVYRMKSDKFELNWYIN
jgi:hypothetical protein